MRIGLAICLWAAALDASYAQQTDVAATNRQALADAMGRMLIGKAVGRPFAPGDVVGGDSDLNLDGFAEMFVYLAANPCDGTDCGLFLFALIGDQYREVLGTVSGARTSSPNSMIDRKRNGYLDIRFGTVEAGWDGSRYVDVTTFARSTLNADAYMAACLAREDNDYAFQQAGADIQSSRDVLCRCKAERFADFGFAQADLDAYLDYIKEPNNYAASKAFDARLASAGDIETGCLVEHGWSSWTQPMGSDDAKEPQKPLAFDAFLQTCSSQDWLIANRKIGSADRALGFCGCLGRKLAAKGFEQPMLDGLASYYRSEIGESELDAISKDVLPISDSESESCATGMPAGAK